MKYVNEYTGKEFTTPEACAQSEKAYEEKLAKAKAEAEEFIQKKEAAEAEIEAAYEVAIQAKDHYNKLVAEYNDNYRRSPECYDFDCKCEDSDDECDCEKYECNNLSEFLEILADIFEKNR